MIGLETLIPQCVAGADRTGASGVARVDPHADRPARRGCLNIPKGTLAPGADADVTIIDPALPLDNRRRQRSPPRAAIRRSTDARYAGRAVCTIVSGEVRYRRQIVSRSAGAQSGTIDELSSFADAGKVWPCSSRLSILDIRAARPGCWNQRRWMRRSPSPRNRRPSD